MLDFCDDGDDAFLAIEYMPNGSLATYLRKNEATITTELRTRWIRQTVEGVALLHANGVIHADLKPTNLLLDGDLNLRIADFGGCSLLGQPPYILESGPFYLPAAWRDKDELGCNAATDLFALGSCIFQIATGRQPYDGMEDGDVEKKFASREFPSLDGVLFAGVVRRCWLSELESAEAVLDALTLEAKNS
ncbi:Protein kinase-like domain protein [Niveomyces insectorum RCEF 264]|uniref:non-specific serine/threonine protein kinase n=1 Tax=Niveomyces insectorum RCEF 264 TaxID=1081102 RepID=A0A162IBG7_9HYPO|nr:Protein kinase-like domain protein [Niveomyces insectorum RCEF 264]